jgi:ribosomal protein L11 methyltransferase
VTTTDGPWTALRVEVPHDAADLVSTFLVEEGAPGVLVDEPDHAGRLIPHGCVRLEAHVPAGDAGRLAGALATYLDALGAVVGGLAGVRVERSPVPALDWHAAFAAHHRPRAVGERLLVAPPWDLPAAPGREVIVVDPGQAFGTGQHATTRGCLEEIEAAAGAGLCSGLDVGTGSGVLAAAMRRLGMHPVVATDIDAAVLPLARRTLDANAATDVSLLAGGAGAVRGVFDLVVANLLADALVTEATALEARVAPGGRLVVSGLLATQAGDVARVYVGWRVTHEVAEDEWRTLRLERTA